MPGFFFVCFLLFFLTTPCSMCDLSFLTRNWTYAPCIGSVELATVPSGKFPFLDFKVSRRLTYLLKRFMCILKGERIYNYKCLQVTKQRDDMVSGEDISYFLPYQKIIPRFEIFFNVQKSNPLIHCALVVDIHLDFTLWSIFLFW